ncbi:MAG: hypothetical protein J7501_05230 [Bdellovibrio sp.]|nr:hypothetical protein [Bdellovibrio sp.]
MKTIKTILIAGSLLISSFAMADQCVDKNGNDIYNTPDVFQELISKSENCYQAAKLAHACAYGSSMDNYTTALASTVCYNELKTLPAKKADLNLLKSMSARCQAHFDKDGGTMARSITAFCHLEAVEFIVKLVQ